jgi:hypothetical protein
MLLKDTWYFGYLRRCTPESGIFPANDGNVKKQPVIPRAGNNLFWNPAPVSF